MIANITCVHFHFGVDDDVAVAFLSIVNSYCFEYFDKTLIFLKTN